MSPIPGEKWVYTEEVEIEEQWVEIREWGWTEKLERCQSVSCEPKGGEYAANGRGGGGEQEEETGEQ